MQMLAINANIRFGKQSAACQIEIVLVQMSWLG